MDLLSAAVHLVQAIHNAGDVFLFRTLYVGTTSTMSPLIVVSGLVIPVRDRTQIVLPCNFHDMVDIQHATPRVI